MPLHLQEICQNNKKQLVEWIYKKLQTAQASYVSNDKTYTLFEFDLVSQINNESIGKIVYTTNKQELLDIDIVLNNVNKMSLKFVEILPQSSQRNEYYLVEDDNQCRFLIETVNRYCIEENILHTMQDVSLSLFPFELAIFDNMEDLNKAMGIKENDIFRISEHFINPMSLFEQTNETYSFLVGEVLDYKEVLLDIGGSDFKFVIAYVDTGVGILPAALNTVNLDSGMLARGKYIAMYTDIKADFKKRAI